VQDRITLGDTLSFPTTVPDYPASAGWTLSYRLIQRTTGTPITLTAITDPDNADGYVVQAAAATTATWTAGEYSWASWVTMGAEVYSLGQGTCTLLPDPRTAAAGVDLRSAAEVALADAKTAYYAYTPTRRSYKIGDREMVFNSAEDLIKHIQFLQAEVTAEKRAADKAKGYADSRKVYVRMAGA
jgi:hypothetical protein